MNWDKVGLPSTTRVALYNIVRGFWVQRAEYDVEAHLLEQETDCILQRAAQPSKLLCISHSPHHRHVY